MKEKEITTIYDERFFALLTAKSQQQKTAKYEYENYIGYIKVSNRPPGEEPFVIGLFVKSGKNTSSILLTKTDIAVITVLFHLFLNSEQDYIETDLYTIHHKYLGQPLKEGENFSDIQATLVKLNNSFIFMGKESELGKTKSKSIFDRFLRLQLTGKDENNKFISFSLGKFGNDIRNRLRYSNLVPIKFIRCKNISRYYIALAICRYIFINSKKKNRTYDIKLQTLLKQINYFDKQGNNTGKSYYDLLKAEKLSNKTYILNQFIKGLKLVLEELKLEHKIIDFDFIDFDSRPSVLNFSNYSINLKLPERKYR